MPDTLTPGTTYTIKVVDASDPGNTSNISAQFTIRPKINVTEPNTTAVINVSDSYADIIKWTITGSEVSKVDIMYSINDGGDNFPYEIARDVLASANKYTWNTVPYRNSTEAKIRIYYNDTGTQSTTCYGNSSVFTINGKLCITAPASTANWSVQNSSAEIHWKGYNVSAVYAWYNLTEGGTEWTQIGATNPTSPGGADTMRFWNVSMPHMTTAMARIKINATYDERINYTSPYFELREAFSFVGVINETVDGPPVAAGETYDINWTRADTNQSLKYITLWFNNS
jgi:hypothetical protein